MSGGNNTLLGLWLIKKRFWNSYAEFIVTAGFPYFLLNEEAGICNLFPIS